jgi:hypothetical protein
MKTKYESTDFQEWLEFGHLKGWISDVFCNTHDGGPMTDEENQEWEDGGDPCMFCVRVNELD